MRALINRSKDPEMAAVILETKENQVRVMWLDLAGGGKNPVANSQGIIIDFLDKEEIRSNEWEEIEV